MNDPEIEMISNDGMGIGASSNINTGTYIPPSGDLDMTLISQFQAYLPPVLFFLLQKPNFR